MPRKDSHHDSGSDRHGDLPSSRSPRQDGGAQGTNDEMVEDWSLLEVVDRVRYDAWRLAAMAWKDVAVGASTTGPGWVAVACLVALAAVLAMSLNGITAWPPYAAVILILLVATWLAPAADRPPHRRLLRRLRRLPTATDTRPDSDVEAGTG